MTDHGPLRINADLAIFVENGQAKFRPHFRDPERVLQAVLHWQSENEIHPRAAFVEEWVQNLEIPAREWNQGTGESELDEAIKTAKTLNQLRRIYVDYRIKAGVPETAALTEAADFVANLREAYRAGSL